MNYRDPYVTTDGPIVRLAAKMLKYDGSLPSATFTPRERWKVGQTSNSAMPSRHQVAYGEGKDMMSVEISSDTDFQNHSKHHAWKMNLNLKIGQTMFCEDVGYPHMQSPNKRDQRHLSLLHDEPIPLTMLEAMVGRQVRDFIELPAWLDEIVGWRKLNYLSAPDPIVFIIDHSDWDLDHDPSL